MNVSWSKRTPLSLKTENKLNQNPVLVFENYNNVPIRKYTNLLQSSKENSKRYKSPDYFWTVKNSLETNLSSFTVHENTLISDRIEKLSTIETKQKERREHQKLMKQDCGKLLTTANKQLKNISYQLSTVISDGEYHLNINPNYSEEFEVIENI